MEKKSRIRFNPVTKEIDVEGSERFVKAYFNKFQATISGPVKKTVMAEKESKAIKAALAKKAEKKVKEAKPGPVKKIRKAAKKKPLKKRISNMASVVELIKASTEGISTTEIKWKTGLTERQIWSIVNRAAKEGKIRKIKRGLYASA